MKPVNQTICNFVNGDCFRACIASIFEVEIEMIPNFMKDGEDKFRGYLEEWADSMGLLVFDVLAGENDTIIFKDCYIMVCGKSPRNKDKLHAVIYYNGKLVHDPHPDKTGIVGEPESTTVIAIKDYCKFKTYSYNDTEETG